MNHGGHATFLNGRQTSGRLPRPIGRPRHEAHQRARHRKFVPTPSGEAVLTLLSPHEATGFEAAKGGKHRAVAHAPSERGRMRVPNDNRKQPGLRHTSR
jgi:hypothetical protein